jgi:hypothetical protein
MCLFCLFVSLVWFGLFASLFVCLPVCLFVCLFVCFGLVWFGLIWFWLVDTSLFVFPLYLTVGSSITFSRLGGTYLCKFKLLGETQLVLNPFHAYQLVPFVKKGNALILFECTSDMSWADLRTKLCGATNPAKADAGMRQIDNFINFLMVVLFSLLQLYFSS